MYDVSNIWDEEEKTFLRDFFSPQTWRRFVFVSSSRGGDTA